MMRAILRRITIPMATNPNSNPKSTKLQNLITQLRLYKQPPSPSFSQSNAEVDDRGKVFSQFGLAESSITTIQSQEKFGPNRAAVLVCLFEGELGDFRVILTKRSSNLSTHSGEVSLPGGKAEEGDANDGETALREAEEEIGLDPKLVTISTVLEPFLSKHLLRVVPVIGILTDRHAFKPLLNAAEVESIFDAPLEMFLKDEKRRSEEREWLGVKFMVHYFDFEKGEKKFVIWGLTASILIRVASVVYQRPPSFLEQERNFNIPDEHLLRVVPVIGILTDRQAFKPVLNAAEVEAIFDAPLEMFLKDEKRRSEEREWLGVKFMVHYFDFETGEKKFVIWGLTASILIRVASVVYQRPPSFLEQERNFNIPGEVNRHHSRQ